MNQETSYQDPTLTIADVAKRLNMSPHFVYRQAASGAMQCYTIGGSTRKCGAIRFSEYQFQEYLESQKQRQCVTMQQRHIDPVKCTPKPNTVSYKLNKLLGKRA